MSAPGVDAPDAPPAPGLGELAVDVARAAGELIVRLRTEGVEVAGTKSSPIDIVTDADRACERLVRERLLGARVYLETAVRVDKEWQRRAHALDRLGL